MNENLIKIVKKINYSHALHRMYIHKEAAAKDYYPGQIHMLRFIDNNEFCTQKELASHLHVTPASIAVSVKRMEKSGLIVRKEDEKDRRVMHLSVTEKGRNSMKSLTEAFSKVDRAMFSGFSDSEIKMLDALLDRICENLTPKDVAQEEICEMVRKNQKYEIGKDGNGD